MSLAHVFHVRGALDDYDLAKRQILQHIGDISNHRVFGRIVMVAMFVRPRLSVGRSIEITEEMQAEDIYQGKTGLIVGMGPGAFQGDDSYIAAMFGKNPHPAIGDWVVFHPNAGTHISLCGEGGTRAEVQINGVTRDAFPWDGWPVRYMADDQIVEDCEKFGGQAAKLVKICERLDRALTQALIELQEADE